MSRLLLGSTLVLTLLLATEPARAASDSIDKTPAPAWIVDYPVDLNAPQPAEGLRDGLWIPLVDEQIDAPSQTEYRHFARKYVTQKAVQDASRLTVDFDPSYETLRWHKLVIHRGGTVIDRLPQQEIRLLSREQNLDANLYNGNVSAVIELQDIRPGDTLEYAFSTQGQNPIFGDKLSDFVSTSWSRYVHQLHFRLLIPADRKIRFQTVNSDLALEQETRGDLIDYRWKANHIAAVDADGGEPSWENPYGWIQLSEYADWGEVVRWALPYYRFTEPLPPALDPLMERLRGIASPEEQILAALEYVQNELRYLSISEGVHSHQPYPIPDVISRGFGDCKDKARLLCAILGNLGYDAKPALVETAYRQTIADWLPTPKAFDHVVVRLKWNKRTYWLDPTVNDQRGALDQRYFPDYRRALVIDEGEDSLTQVTPSGFSASTMRLEERYTVPSFRDTVEFETRTTYRGGQADAIRSSLAGSTIKELGDNYLNFYARLHPSIRSVSPPVIKDDPAKNEIIIEEKYRIPEFWQPRAEDDRRLYADLYAHLLGDDFSAPSKPLRKSSLAISHPRNVEHIITVEMPDDSKFQSESHTIRDPAFTYNYSVSQKGRSLSISHRYASKQESISPSALSPFLANLRTSRNLLSYSISIPRATAGDSAKPSASSARKLNATLISFALLIVQISSACVLALFFWRPRWPERTRDLRFEGLGGWLILVCLGLFARLVVQLTSARHLAPFLFKDSWVALTDPSMPNYHWAWGPAILLETAVVIVMVFYTMLLIVLFFQRRRTFPVLMLIMIAATPFIILCDNALAGQATRTLAPPAAGSGTAQIFGVFFGAAIWILYIVRSRRVRATFTR